MREKALRITSAVYRVTAEIPQSEGLRFKIREKAGEALGDIIEYGYLPEEKKALLVFAKIEAIKSYLEIMRVAGFVKSINCVILLREYEVLAEFFSKELVSRNRKFLTGSNHNFEVSLPSGRETSPVEVSPRLDRGETSPNNAEVSLPVGRETSTNGGLNARQKAILAHLKQAGEAKISDFFEKFQGISSKTIQRDLQNLAAKDLLKKEGDKRWTTYSL